MLMSRFGELLRAANNFKLLAARWEEGWERPVSEWRQQLGISDPADGRPYGLV
jgi:ubiquinone biosynthesis protein Coq4